MSDQIPRPVIIVRAPMMEAEWAHVDRVRAAIRDGTIPVEDAVAATGLSVRTVRAWAAHPEYMGDSWGNRCVAWARRQLDPAVLTPLGTPSLLAVHPLAPAQWAVPAAEIRARLERALGWLGDPEHPVQRLVAANRARMAAEGDPTWRADADARLLYWLLGPAVNAALQRDAAAEVRRQLVAWARAN